MLTIGDVYVYVTDFNAALRFYRDGLGLAVVEEQLNAAAPFAVLDFPEDVGSSIRLFGGASPWPEGARPDVGQHPTIRFDVLTDEFDKLLLRLLEHGGAQAGEIETYGDLRVVTIADPDGNTFELIEVPADEERDEE